MKSFNLNTGQKTLRFWTVISANLKIESYKPTQKKLFLSELYLPQKLIFQNIV